MAGPTANYTRTRLTNAPRWSATINADYSGQIAPDLRLKAHVDYNYRSSTQTILGDLLAAPVKNADGTTPNASYSFIPAYGLANTRIGIGKLNDKLELGVYARNLFNTYYSTGWQVVRRSWAPASHYAECLSDHWRLCEVPVLTNG